MSVNTAKPSEPMSKPLRKRRTPPLTRPLLRALLTPQSLLGGLVFIAGLVAFLRAVPGVRVPPPERVVVDAATPATPAEDVRLSLITADGSERFSIVPLALPADPSSRRAALLNALRSFLTSEAGERLWPEALSAPTVFTLTNADRAEVTVLDFTRGPAAAVSVAREARLLASIRTTLRRDGVDHLRVLINGEPSETFLGHLALENP